MSTPIAPPLAGMRTLVLGAGGEVGEGLVSALLAAGATVIGLSRSAARLAAVQARLEHTVAGGAATPVRFLTVLGDVLDVAQQPVLRRAVERDGPLDGVIASLGGWRQGPPLIDLPPAEWEEALTQSLTAHVRAASTFLPLVRDRVAGSYTLINGGAALYPVPGAGAMSISAAAQRMLMQVLAREHRTHAVRINTLLLATPVRTRGRPLGPAEWISAADAGAWAVHLAEPRTHYRGETILVDAVHSRPPAPDATTVSG